MENIIFTPETITLNGQNIPASYTIDQTNNVFVALTIEEYGETSNLMIKITPEHEHHAAAFAAAQPIKEAPETSEPETPSEEPPARDPKQTRGEVPEKLFAGLEITGKGWKILFDKTYDRTRVIFDKMPSKAAREAVKAAGFYWSPVLESWNKKLTFKAFRKAQDLAKQLHTICG